MVMRARFRRIPRVAQHNQGSFRRTPHFLLRIQLVSVLRQTMDTIMGFTQDIAKNSISVHQDNDLNNRPSHWCMCDAYAASIREAEY